MNPSTIIKTSGKSIPVSLLVTLAAISFASKTHAAALLLSDNFNGTGINSALASRQGGTLSPASWNNYFGANPTITSNQMRTSNDGIFNQANLLSSLTDSDLVGIPGFVVSFDAQHLSGTTNWISPFLSTHEGGSDDRGVTQFGLLIFGNGNVNAYRNNGGVQGTTQATNAAIGGLVTGWDPNNMNSYSLVATRTTTTTGAYDVFINGVEVISDVAYSFSGTGATMNPGFTGLYWANRDNGVNSAYDNLAIETIPEPAALSLVGLSGILLLRRRRS